MCCNFRKIGHVTLQNQHSHEVEIPYPGTSDHNPHVNRFLQYSRGFCWPRAVSWGDRQLVCHGLTNSSPRRANVMCIRRVHSRHSARSRTPRYWRCAIARVDGLVFLIPGFWFLISSFRFYRFRDKYSGFRVQLRVWCLRVLGLGFRVQGLGFRVQGSDF